MTRYRHTVVVTLVVPSAYQTPCRKYSFVHLLFVMDTFGGTVFRKAALHSREGWTWFPYLRWVIYFLPSVLLQQAKDGADSRKARPHGRRKKKLGERNERPWFAAQCCHIIPKVIHWSALFTCVILDPVHPPLPSESRHHQSPPTRHRHLILLHHSSYHNTNSLLPIQGRHSLEASQCLKLRLFHHHHQHQHQHQRRQRQTDANVVFHSNILDLPQPCLLRRPWLLLPPFLPQADWTSSTPSRIYPKAVQRDQPDAQIFHGLPRKSSGWRLCVKLVVVGVILQRFVFSCRGMKMKQKEEDEGSSEKVIWLYLFIFASLFVYIYRLSLIAQKAVWKSIGIR